MTYRCRTCSINYPIRNEYQKCPVCQEDTSMMTFTDPDEDWEWKATLLLAKVTPAEFEGPVPQLPVNAVQDNNGQFWLSAKELIAKGFSRRLRFEEVIELPAMPPKSASHPLNNLWEVQGWRDSTRSYWIRPLRVPDYVPES